MRKLLLLFSIVFSIVYANAQEHVAPINYNPLQKRAAATYHSLHKTTALSLPFFEDFTGYGVFPDSSKWVDNETYVNNTMCVSPISRGVATFDALNQYGIPYDTTSNTTFSYADSLTSQPIDLSGYGPGDSLYFSFFYQPGGYGFYPQTQDSLILFMRLDYGNWVPVWQTPGTSLQPFKQVMIPITDSEYFYSSFQFRFVNIAALDYADAVWNVDYIRLNTGRNMNDTAINDVAFTSNPTSLLNDYTYMPYRQFMANPNGERATGYTDSIHNNYTLTESLTYGFTANETISNTPLFTAPTNTATLSPQQIQQLSYPAYTNTVPMQGPDDKVVFENKYYIQSIPGDNSTANDTIVHDQVFDNYLAYDDGTAEQSYYLTMSASQPATLAIEYHLNQPDTLQGVAFYFGRMAPMSDYKYFSIVVYKALGGIAGADTDVLLREEDNLNPAFGDTVNQFFVYRLDTPVVLPAGTFYVGAIQPAYSGSDSLYYGLDMNRIGANHVFYNTLDQWLPSQILGAVMIRPLLGQPVYTTSVSNVSHRAPEWSVSPNPTRDNVRFSFTANSNAVVYRLMDIQGRSIMTGTVKDGSDINISNLSSGVYLVTLTFDGLTSAPKKIVKQ